MRRIEHIADSLREVFAISKRDDVPTNTAAQRLAEERMAAARQS